MNLSPHFTLEEAVVSQTATRNGIDNTPGREVIEAMGAAALRLEAVRSLLQAPIIVTSWYRSPKVDQLVGGTGRFNGHSSGWCIDFISKPTPREVCLKILEAKIPFDQLIYEGTWTHISFHPAMRQMALTAIFSPGKPTTYVGGIK